MQHTAAPVSLLCVIAVVVLLCSHAPHAADHSSIQRLTESALTICRPECLHCALPYTTYNEQVLNGSSIVLQEPAIKLEVSSPRGIASAYIHVLDHVHKVAGSAAAGLAPSFSPVLLITVPVVVERERQRALLLGARALLLLLPRLLGRGCCLFLLLPFLCLLNIRAGTTTHQDQSSSAAVRDMGHIDGALVISAEGQFCHGSHTPDLPRRLHLLTCRLSAGPLLSVLPVRLLALKLCRSLQPCYCCSHRERAPISSCSRRTQNVYGQSARQKTPIRPEQSIFTPGSKAAELKRTTLATGRHAPFLNCSGGGEGSALNAS